MRTDSTRISDVAKEEAADYIGNMYGKEYLQNTDRKEKKNANAQDAHEAIRPTSTLREPSSLKEFLSRDQLRLYKLIWERFVASQMAPAVMDTMAVDLTNGPIVFRANGSKIKFSGFMKVYVEGTDDPVDEKKDRQLPDLAVGDKVISKEIDSKATFQTATSPLYGSKACKNARRAWNWTSVNLCSYTRYYSKKRLCFS